MFLYLLDLPSQVLNFAGQVENLQALKGMGQGQGRGSNLYTRLAASHVPLKGVNRLAGERQQAGDGALEDFRLGHAVGGLKLRLC
jgi:hypothetical protein